MRRSMISYTHTFVSGLFIKKIYINWILKFFPTKKKRKSLLYEFTIWHLIKHAVSLIHVTSKKF